MGTRPLPKKRAEPPPQFSVHFYCCQTAGCIKTPLGTEVVLVTGRIVLYVVPPVRERGTAAPPLSPMSIVAAVAHLSNYC